jgi:RimJ/RimL family protein N-acetyltransferase
LKTDARNQRSQRAIERLGATREGILRQDTITPEGYLRDSVYYSILDREWPQVKTLLEDRLEKYYLDSV